MRIGLLATGDEIINGEILNTNAQAMALSLVENGFEVGHHVICSDAEDDLNTALHFQWLQHEVLIVTGGLGPTSDDRTRYAVAKLIGVSLLFSETTWQAICEFIGKKAIEHHTPENQQQAYFPEGATILPNPHGTACGCKIEKDNKVLYMLPGPPHECLPMFHHYVLPDLTLKNPSLVEYYRWRLFGITEAQMGKQLDALMKPYGYITGYRWDYPYIDFKIKVAQPPLAETARLLIEDFVKPYLLTPTGEKASIYLKEKLLNSTKVITIIDHATAGCLEQTLLTPHTKNKLCFSKGEMVSSGLCFKIEGLAELWEQYPLPAETTIRMTISVNDVMEYETLNYVMRNDRARLVAVEWIASVINRYL